MPKIQNSKIIDDAELLFFAKFSVMLGVFLIIISYFLNTNLLTTLENNLQGKSSSIGEDYKSNLGIPNKLTDNIVIKPSLSWAYKTCRFIANDSENWQITDDYLLLLTPNFGFKEIPVFKDLVNLRDLGLDTYQFTRLREEPAEALVKMSTDLRNEKISIFVSSGYRTYADQVKNLVNWTQAIGPSEAKAMAAKPGFSEHHLGTTVDLLTKENGMTLMPSYEKTKLFSWLQKNAHKYGFVMSYPAGYEGTTGYNYEPWHYRYVGIELASQLKESEILLQDYLYQLNNYCLVGQ